MKTAVLSIENNTASPAAYPQCNHISAAMNSAAYWRTISLRKGGIAYDMRDHIRVTDGEECALADFTVHAETYGFFRAADHLL